MKVVLFYPPNNEEYGVFEAAQPLDYPLGLCYIATVLENRGHQVKIFDLDHDKKYNGIKSAAAILEEEKPDIVGISCLTYNRKNAWRLAKIAKVLDSNVKVFMGGPHATFYPEQLLQHFPIDFILTGEAEATLDKLMEALENNTDFEEIPGLAFKIGDRIKINKNPEWSADINSLPFPAHHHFADKIREKKWAHVIGNRGCPFGCNFCSTTYFWGLRTRKRDPKLVVDEVEHLVKEYGATDIYFEDDTFSIDQEWSKQVCQEIINRDMKIKWMAITRFNCISKELLELMEKSGCEKLTFGLESGAASILNNLHKGLNKQVVIEGFALMKQTKIRTALFMMIGNPGETEETVKETCELLDQVGFHDVDAASILQLFPNTPFYHMAKAKGLIDDDFWIKEDAPIPYYLAEHDLKTLQKYALQLIMHCQKKKGLASWTRFSATAARKIAIRKVKEIKRVVIA